MENRFSNSYEEKIFTDVEIKLDTRKLTFQQDLIRDLVSNLISVTGFILKLEPFFRCALGYETEEAPDGETKIVETGVIFTIDDRHVSTAWIKRALAAGMKKFGVCLDSEITVSYGVIYPEKSEKFDLSDYLLYKNAIDNNHPGIVSYERVNAMSEEFKQSLNSILDDPETMSIESLEFIDEMCKLFKDYKETHEDEGSIYAQD